MFEKLLHAIRSRSRSEWEKYSRERLERLREYCQLHGERAALIGFIIGMLMVLFYKLALVVVCVAVVTYQLILIIAETDSEKHSDG